MKQEFDAILKCSQNYPFELHTDGLFEKWETNKAPFLKLFNDTYIRSREPITIKLDESEKSIRFQDFVNTLDDNNLLTPDLKDFLEKNEKGFFENKVVSPVSNCNIPLGAKISKAFKKFIPNPSSLDWAQTIASRYIQEDKITGYLYLSVDPRDYLTLSENGEDWRSCQALDGSYKAGNLNYMVDKTTVVAYLADKEPKWFPPLPSNQKWFSKRWRMLLHINLVGKCVYYNKQYPYFSNALQEATFALIQNNILEDINSPATTGFRFYYQGNQAEILPRNQIQDAATGYVHDTTEIIDMNDYHGYKDLYISTDYVPVTSVNKENVFDYRAYCFNRTNLIDRAKETKLFLQIFGIKIGEEASCVCCGRGAIEREDSFLCEDCMDMFGEEEFFDRCAECGHRIDTDIYSDGYEYYCETCYNRRVLNGG